MRRLDQNGSRFCFVCVFPGVAVRLIGISLLKFTSAVLFSLALAVVDARADDVPFNLHWGDSLAFLSGKDVAIEVEKDDGQAVICQLRNLRPVPQNTGMVRAVVDRTLGLQRIIWRSKDIVDQPTGVDGVAAYQAMKDKLSEQYGQPRNSSEESGASVYTAPSQFYQCLASDGCAAYVSRWNSDDGEVYLHLIPGEAANSGRLEVTYDGPEWSRVKNGRRGKP